MFIYAHIPTFIHIYLCNIVSVERGTAGFCRCDKRVTWVDGLLVRGTLVDCCKDQRAGALTCSVPVNLKGTLELFLKT
jgi:hypothetical protein